jgi:hypothetical protein
MQPTEHRFAPHRFEVSQDMARPPPPEEPEPGSVRANHGPGSHHDQRRAPFEQPRQQRQAHPCRCINPPGFHPALHLQGQLAAQEQNLCLKGLALPKPNSNPSNQVGYHSYDNGDSAQHPPIMPYQRCLTRSEASVEFLRTTGREGHGRTETRYSWHREITQRIEVKGP